MNRQKIGQVTEKEKNEILILYERLKALEEIAQIVASEYFSQEKKQVLDEKVSSQTIDTRAKFNDWWDSMSSHYGWKGLKGGNWQIDFASNEVFLLENH